MNIFFTADWHNLHYNILRYCNRPFKNEYEQQQCLLDNHNSIVRTKDTVYYLGDIAMTKEGAITALSKMNGQKIFILGNHDFRFINTIKEYCKEVHNLHDIRIGQQKITLCHYAMRVWNCSHHGAWELYAHCLDDETEILTDNGWKKRSELLYGHKILTLNIENKKLEYNEIDEIIDYNHTGDVYNIKSKGLDLRLTPNHILIDILIGRKKEEFRKFYTDEIFKINKRKFKKSAIGNQTGINLNNDQIKLLVWIAADGNLCNTDLIRIRVFKTRKINRIENLLKKLNINYSRNKQKDDSICFNFHKPDYFYNIRLKPISDIIIDSNQNQLDIILEEYTHTDGYKNKTSILIYTSKKIEADLIQTACIRNEYMCNISERRGGFAKKINYELVVTKRSCRTHDNLKNKVFIETVNNEHFWCVKVKNKTIVIRRNGKHIIVGNSHGELPSLGKSYDVGVDNNNFKPVSYEELKIIMSKKECHHLV